MPDAERDDAPKQPASITPSLEMVMVVYVVLAVFIGYLIYMYYPVTVQRLFYWLFGPWMS